MRTILSLFAILCLSMVAAGCGQSQNAQDSDVHVHDDGTTHEAHGDHAVTDDHSTDDHATGDDHAHAEGEGDHAH